MTETHNDQEDWYADEVATFGDRLAGARETEGLTQQELSKRLGVKLKTLRSWEEDLAEPRANKLQMLAGLLNVSIVWLLTGQGDGVDAPAEEAVLPTDIRAILSEVRVVKTEMSAMADRLGRLEKRLRETLKEES